MVPEWAAVVRNLKSKEPAATAVAGQSVRAQSRARYFSRFAEQSLPSGMRDRCCPSALAMLTSFQS